MLRLSVGSGAQIAANSLDIEGRLVRAPGTDRNRANWLPTAPRAAGARPSATHDFSSMKTSMVIPSGSDKADTSSSTLMLPSFPKILWKATES